MRVGVVKSEDNQKNEGVEAIENQRQCVRKSVRRSTQRECQNEHVTSRRFTHGMMMALSLKAWQTARVTKYMPSTCLQGSLRKVVHGLLTLR